MNRLAHHAIALMLMLLVGCARDDIPPTFRDYSKSDFHRKYDATIGVRDENKTWFSDLYWRGEETVIEVDYDSTGCFHSFNYRLLFHGTEMDGPVVDVQLLRNKSSTQPTELKRYELTSGDLDRLDNMLVLARQPYEPGGSTTTTNFTVRLLHEGKVIRTESFKDYYEEHDLPFVLTFWELLDRFDE